MTYLSPPGAEEPQRPGSEGAIPSAGPPYGHTYVDGGAGYQPAPGYQPAAGYPGYETGYPQPYPQSYAYQPVTGYPQPYPTPYGYGDPYGQMGFAPFPRPYDGMAIAALVVSCVAVFGLCLYGLGGLIGAVGAILGHVSRRRIQRSGAQGDGMALAGVIVGWIAAALGVIFIAFWIVIIAIGINTDTSTSTT